MTTKNPNPNAILTSRFYRADGAYHGAIDLAKGQGSPIYAFADGEVAYVNTGCTVGNYECGNKGGNWVKIKHPNGYITKYLHLSSVNVRVGQQVKAGQLIGTEGNTGYSFGSHLHFAMEKDGQVVDPEPYWNGTKPFPGMDVMSVKKKSSYLPLHLSQYSSCTFTSSIKRF